MEIGETWRAVSGYEDIYEVSDRGRVRSLDRIVASASREPQRLRGKVLKPGKASSGYLSVALCRDGKPRSHNIHVLVAGSFIGLRPRGLDIDHIDGVRTNNLPSNLRYVEHAVNGRNITVTSSRSGKLGVYPTGAKWAAQIWHDGRQIHLGTFPTIEAAADARAAYETASNFRGLIHVDVRT